MSRHPSEVLQEAQAGHIDLPVVDHYCGVEARILKSLALQAEMAQSAGVCLFDVTLDCEDGAPVGKEAEHAQLVLAILKSHHAQAQSLAQPIKPRTAVRVHPIDHPTFVNDVQTIVPHAAQLLCHIMLPKVESVEDIDNAVRVIDAAGGQNLPLHVLIESPLAVHHAYAIAAHPRVQSLSFGLMDFVSSHHGAIPDQAMSLTGQFQHPLVVQAKLHIASACHAYGKVPSHCVVTEFKDSAAIESAALRAKNELGFTRQWSIHPDQIAPILRAFTPADGEVSQAAEIIAAAYTADWAPISHRNQLHDRASFRYYWQVLQKARRAGKTIPSSVSPFFH